MPHGWVSSQFHERLSSNWTCCSPVACPTDVILHFIQHPSFFEIHLPIWALKPRKLSKRKRTVRTVCAELALLVQGHVSFLGLRWWHHLVPTMKAFNPCSMWTILLLWLYDCRYGPFINSAVNLDVNEKIPFNGSWVWKRHEYQHP